MGNFDVVAFGETLAANGLTALTSIVDTLYSSTGDTITVRDLENAVIFGFMAHGANMTRAKLDIESFLVDLDAYIGVAILSGRFGDMIQPDLKIPANELITGYLDNGNNNEASDLVLLIAYGQPPKLSPIPLTDGLKHVVVVGGTACVAYTWTDQATITFPTLPQGIYEIWGLQAESATGIAVRVTEKKERKFHAGVPCMKDMIYFNKPLATFDQKNKPTISMLAVGTDATCYITMALKKVG